MNRLQRLDVLRTLIEANGGEFQFSFNDVDGKGGVARYKLADDNKWVDLAPDDSPFKLEENMSVKLHEIPIQDDRLGVIAKIKDKRKMLKAITASLSQKGLSLEHKVIMICEYDDGLFAPRTNFKEALHSALKEHMHPEHIIGKLDLKGQSFIFKQHHKGVNHPGYDNEKIKSMNGEAFLTNPKEEMVAALAAAANKEYMSPDAFVIEVHGEFIARNLSVTEPHDKQEVGTLSVNVERKLRDTLEIYRELGREAFELFAEGIVCKVNRPDQIRSTISRESGLAMLKNTLRSNDKPVDTEGPSYAPVSPRKMEIVRVLTLREELAKWRRALDIVIEKSPEIPEDKINKRWSNIIKPTEGVIGTVSYKAFEFALTRASNTYGDLVKRTTRNMFDDAADKIEDLFPQIGNGEVAKELHGMLGGLKETMRDYPAQSVIVVLDRTFNDSTLTDIAKAAKDAASRGIAYSLPEKEAINSNVQRVLSKAHRSSYAPK
jgi:hypothetical protein